MWLQHIFLPKFSSSSSELQHGSNKPCVLKHPKCPPLEGGSVNFSTAHQVPPTMEQSYSGPVITQGNTGARGGWKEEGSISFWWNLTSSFLMTFLLDCSRLGNKSLFKLVLGWHTVYEKFFEPQCSLEMLLKMPLHISKFLCMVWLSIFEDKLYRIKRSTYLKTTM